MIDEIRGAIGDRARDGEVVRTVHGYGYAFAAEVEREEPGVSEAAGRAVCWLLCGSREIALGDGTHIIGREPDAAVWLDSPNVSRHHARVVVRGARATIEDLESKNGSFVGGVRVSAPTPLGCGDSIRIGPFTLVFRISGELASTETEIA